MTVALDQRFAQVVAAGAGAASSIRYYAERSVAVDDERYYHDSHDQLTLCISTPLHSRPSALRLSPQPSQNIPAVRTRHVPATVVCPSLASCHSRSRYPYSSYFSKWHQSQFQAIPSRRGKQAAAMAVVPPERTPVFRAWKLTGVDSAESPDACPPEFSSRVLQDVAVQLQV